MAMSYDRQVFTLTPTYYQDHRTSNGMMKDVCVGICADAFGTPHGVIDEAPERVAWWKNLLENSPNGLVIISRPSQFARFITLRHERGRCINGVKDLNPRIMSEEEVEDMLARSNPRTPREASELRLEELATHLAQNRINPMARRGMRKVDPQDAYQVLKALMDDNPDLFIVGKVGRGIGNLYVSDRRVDEGRHPYWLKQLIQPKNTVRTDRGHLPWINVSDQHNGIERQMRSRRQAESYGGEEIV